MSATTAAKCLAEKPSTQREVEEILIGLSEDECAAVLQTVYPLLSARVKVSPLLYAVTVARNQVVAKRSASSAGAAR